tara:strand:- start:774 stop:1466 length:693 start_codon:yes stop_codon:yes gene_type:complete
MYTRIFNNILQALFIICVPLLLITTNVRIVLNSATIYDYGFNKYKIEKHTGIEFEQLQLAGKQIRDYFNNDLERITINISLRGENVPNLFNEREILHMYDVKNLVKMVYMVQLYSAVFLSLGCVFMLFNSFTNGRILTMKYIGRGGVFAFSLVIAVSILAIIGFDRLFLFFHLVSFSNDLWVLDPRRDYLIAMFPQGFFFDCTVVIACLTLVEGVILSLIPRAIRLFVKK